MVSELLCQRAGAPRIGFPKPGVSLQDGLLRQRHQPASECQAFTGSRQLPTLVLPARNERGIDIPFVFFLLCSANSRNLSKLGVAESLLYRISLLVKLGCGAEFANRDLMCARQVPPLPAQLSYTSASTVCCAHWSSVGST